MRDNQAWSQAYVPKDDDSLDLNPLRSILSSVRTKVAALRQQSVIPFAVAFAAFGAFAFAYFFFA